MSVEIARVGATAWPRFVLVRDGEAFWDGCRWVARLREARLYASRHAVSREFEQIRLAELEESASREFETTIRIRVRGDAAASLSVEQLIRYLHQHAELVIPVEDPATGKLVQAEIAWHLLRETRRNRQ